MLANRDGPRRNQNGLRMMSAPGTPAEWDVRLKEGMRRGIAREVTHRKGSPTRTRLGDEEERACTREIKSESMSIVEWPTRLASDRMRDASATSRHPVDPAVGFRVHFGGTAQGGC